MFWRTFFSSDGIGKLRMLKHVQKSLIYLFIYLFTYLLTYRSSQARGLIGAIATGLHHRHNNLGSEPCLRPTYTTAHGNARSLTRWARPGIEPTFSWILVRFVSTEPQWELQVSYLNNNTNNFFFFSSV